MQSIFTLIFDTILQSLAQINSSGVILSTEVFI